MKRELTFALNGKARNVTEAMIFIPHIAWTILVSIVCVVFANRKYGDHEQLSMG